MAPSTATSPGTTDHATASTSVLLNLPRSIKVRIYHYALLADRALDFDKEEFLTQYALLNTCTQIRKEATPIFFSNNVFVISNIQSASTNFLKAADGSIKKVFIDIAITERVRKECKNHPGAIAAALYTCAYLLPDFLLMWGPPAAGIKLVWPEKKNGKFTADQSAVYMLNMAFQERLEAQLKPVPTAMRSMTKKKIYQIKATEEAASGMINKVGFKSAEFSNKVAAELNRRHIDESDFATFIDELSVDERREVARHILNLRGVNVVAKENGKAAKAGTKEKLNKNKKKAKAQNNDDGRVEKE